MPEDSLIGNPYLLEKDSFFVLSYQDFRTKLLGVPKLRDRALFAVIYASFGRVGEITRRRASCKPFPPMNKDQLEFTDEHLMISVKTEKTGQWRKVPVSKEREQWLISIIQQWLSVCGYELFPISTMWAEKLFEKHFGTQHIHLLRHWATTHALQGHRTKEPLMPTEIARLGGWTNLNTFYRTYSHFSVDDFKHKI
jgi:integrase